jgi:hypothetical protein
MGNLDPYDGLVTYTILQAGSLLGLHACHAGAT